jgi:hypothetical protein
MFIEQLTLYFVLVEKDAQILQEYPCHCEFINICFLLIWCVLAFGIFIVTEKYLHAIYMWMLLHANFDIDGLHHLLR